MVSLKSPESGRNVPCSQTVPLVAGSKKCWWGWCLFAYFIPNSDLKNVPIAVKMSGVWALTGAASLAGDAPPHPHPLLLAPLAGSVYVCRTQGLPFGHPPVHDPSAASLQISLQLQAAQLIFPIGSFAVSVIQQVFPSGHVPLHEPPAGSQEHDLDTGVGVRSPAPLQWHSA
jgi:hypothetical protein